MTFPGAAGGATSDGGFVVAAAALDLVAALLNGAKARHGADDGPDAELPHPHSTPTKINYNTITY